MTYFSTNSIPQATPKDHKVALITGVGIKGIGFYTALNLFTHGYIVYIAGRNPQRVAEAHKAIEKEALKRYSDAGSSDSKHFGEIHELKIDLTKLKSVKECAKDFLSKETKLDLLIDNAGLMAAPFSITEDGFEIQMQTNYIAHVLLDELLLPTMERTSTAPRLVYVSSLGHKSSSGRQLPDETFNHWPELYYTWKRYGLSKLFGIHYVKMTAINHPKVLSIAVHPGLIVDTGLFAPYAAAIGPWLTKILTTTFSWFGVDAETGSLSTLRAATSPELTAEANNGIYLDVGGPETSTSKLGSDLGYAKESYTWTIEKLKSLGYL